VYDAKRRCARLAREIWNDVELATRLDHEAAELSERFDEAFWLPERGVYALAARRLEATVDSSRRTSVICSGAASSRRRRLPAPRLLVGERLSRLGRADDGRR